jgi:hypothetical protein
MRIHLVLVAGLVLSSCLPMEAQTPAAKLVLAQTFPGISIMLFRAPQVGLSLIVSPAALPRIPHPASLLGGAYILEPSLESRLPIEVVRTSFLTESSFLIAHVWRRVQLDVFESTLHSRSLVIGSPSFASGIQDFWPSSHDQAGVANSIGFDGISLRYTFGRKAETGKANQI